MRRLIRYKNRHIYDYETCSYVKLPNILELVSSRIEFCILDEGTKEDITREVLLGVIQQNILSKYIFPKEVLFDVLKKTPVGESTFLRLFNFKTIPENEIRNTQGFDIKTSTKSKSLPNDKLKAEKNNFKNESVLPTGKMVIY